MAMRQCIPISKGLCQRLEINSNPIDVGCVEMDGREENFR